jgi:hypothetical protein
MLSNDNQSSRSPWLVRMSVVSAPTPTIRPSTNTDQPTTQPPNHPSPLQAIVFRVLEPVSPPAASRAYFRLLRATNAHGALTQFLFHSYERGRPRLFYVQQATAMHFVLHQSDSIVPALCTPDVAACLVRMCRRLATLMVADPECDAQALELVARCFLRLFRGFVDAPPRPAKEVRAVVCVRVCVCVCVHACVCACVSVWLCVCVPVLAPWMHPCVRLERGRMLHALTASPPHQE